MKWCRFEPEYEAALRAAGLESFDAIMSTDAGQLASVRNKLAEVRRVDLEHTGGPATIFIKKSTNEPRGKLLRSLAYAARPHVGAIREHQLLTKLHEAGFGVMRPIAWGECTRLGLPVSGFLIVKGITGLDAHDVREQAGVEVRCQLMKDFGNLTGRLHAAGFFQPVRLKDLICRDADAESSGPFDLLLIDRATSKPWSSWFSRGKCLRAIRRAFRRSSRDGMNLSDGERRAFAEGYCAAVAPQCTIAVAEVEAMISDGRRKADAARATAEPSTGRTGMQPTSQTR